MTDTTTRSHLGRHEPRDLNKEILTVFALDQEGAWMAVVDQESVPATSLGTDTVFDVLERGISLRPPDEVWADDRKWLFRLQTVSRIDLRRWVVDWFTAEFKVLGKALLDEDSVTRLVEIRRAWKFLPRVEIKSTDRFEQIKADKQPRISTNRG